ncbi:hypothetical protein O181_041121 [Austropuccinia psidii MF-1]|uniref:CCHC-type domain-containing protein n=1 Tax=Austropuccinia psidii MF-1 TaxID=1389203 RepID=A0A9Q3DCJ6_9BASI|nr:hypothetical protein [Austropuccinia psidii MF-1]
MSPVHVRNLGFQRNQPEDREGLSRTRRPRRGHLGHSGGWQDTEGNHTHSAIHFPIQQEPQTRGLERYRPKVQPGIPLGRTWSKLPEDLSQRDRLQRPYGNHQRTTADPDRAYSDSFRLTRSSPNQLSSGFKPIRNQQISGQESPFFTIPGSFQEKTRIQGKKQDHLQPEEERVRPNDPEAVGFGERSVQEPEVVVNNSRISSPINRNITPTQIDHHVVTPESNLKSDALWLQMFQFSEKTKKQFAELQASHERMKKLTASMDKIVKTLQEGHAQLSKASEETNKILNLVFEEQHHSKRDRYCLDQDINKLFNFYDNMKPKPQGHVMDNPYHQDEIKPDSMLINKAISSSQYQDGDNMSYSEKEALKQLCDACSWPKFLGTEEYDHMELIDYINGLSIDVSRIPDYWITARLNTAFEGNANDIANTLQDVRKRTNIGKYTPYKRSSFKEKQPFRVEFKEKLKERVAEVEKKKISCHNCGSTDHYSNNCPKENKKVYAIEKGPEEESPTEDSDSDSMGDAIREQSDDDQYPREEFLVECQEDTPLEIKDIQLEAGMPKDTANKNLCKHTQDAQTFLVTPTKGMEYLHGTATKMTVCIENAQHPLIIESGAHCSIVARNYLDNHLQNWKTSSCPPRKRTSKMLQGK